MSERLSLRKLILQPLAGCGSWSILSSSWGSCMTCSMVLSLMVLWCGILLRPWAHLLDLVKMLEEIFRRPGCSFNPGQLTSPAGPLVIMASWIA